MMETKKYLTPKISITAFDAQDIITLSVTDSTAVDVTAGWMEDDTNGMS